MNVFKCWTAAALLAIICSYPALGQTLVTTDELPDAPSATMQNATASNQSGDPQGTARVEGIVQDVQGDPIPGAKIFLNASGKIGDRTVVADTDGSFHFTALTPALYRIIITAPGFANFTSGGFALKPGETFEVPKIALVVSSNSSVDVIATPDQIAVAQVQEQEKQRVLGIFPNFYTSYIWKPEPMPVKQKYKLAFRTLGDPITFLLVAGIAGAEHFNGTYPGYGSGIQGYGKRYAAAYGDALTARVIGSAILPSVLHQDPRYFYQGTGGTRSRALHAMASTFIARGDSGKNQPNYSHLLGSLAAGAIANSYHPESSRGLGLTFETFGIATGANVIGNLIREFILRGLVPSVPDFASGKE